MRLGGGRYRVSKNYHRRSIRLPERNYHNAGMYYITVCAYNRECLFGEIIDRKMNLNQYGRIVHDEWVRTANVRSNVELGAFVIMPNHFHAIIKIIFIGTNKHVTVGATRRVAPTLTGIDPISSGPQSGSIGAIIGQFKSTVTKQINQIRQTPGTPIWQRNYYEHIIRQGVELDEKRKYIINNLANWDVDEENVNRCRGEVPSPCKG
ncbi:MAG: transposase [Candidatus Omnitrophica bacterium]|nr:transposase [Candidatus Omnitrophota bacterium]